MARQALLEWAAGGRPEEGHGESRSDHSGLRRDPVSLRDNGSFRILQTEEARARQNENSLESAIARIERRMALGEDRTARAFETIAHMLDRPRGSRVTLFTETGRSTVEDAVSRVATQPFEAHVANAVPGSEEKSVSPRNLDERMEDIARRIGNSRQSPNEPGQPHDSIAKAAARSGGRSIAGYVEETGAGRPRGPERIRCAPS